MITETLFDPLNGAEHTIQLPKEDRADLVIPSVNTYNGIQVDYRIADGDSWIGILWTLEREGDTDETLLEDNGSLEMYCPNCGAHRTSEIQEYDEFEIIQNFCDDCGDTIQLIRDQPTESGQSHVINYEFHIYSL